ncbi:MAG: HAMP domain-containing sensor histidine kinase [Flavobacterium sp.]|nr:HAMP domain-containing sensor histidine kinase [Flavobacterium sp.]
MKIRNKLTLLFTLLAASILLVYAVAIYISASENREKEFYDLLTKEAITKANLFLNAKVPTQSLHDIYSNNRKILNEVEVALYNLDHELLYHDAVEIDIVKETPELLKKIEKDGNVSFYEGKWQILGMLYEVDQQKYIVTAAAIDQYGYNKLNHLIYNSILIFFGSIILIYLLGLFFAKKAFLPVHDMTSSVQKISANQLGVRLIDSGNKDELSELAKTFNIMLDRLENSFESQKQFVSHISHELRTPLSAMITELELSLQKERDHQHYQLAISQTLEDAKKLARLSGNLLDLAKASYDTSEISFKKFRIDEALLEAVQELQHLHPEYKIDLYFSSSFENDEDVLVKGNEYLMRVAFLNLMENACKFSNPSHCKVTITQLNNSIQFDFEDHGIGIPSEELTQLFTPFFRGTNQTYSQGNGIGLSLTQKIISLHNGTITVQSEVKKGTKISVVLNH